MSETDVFKVPYPGNDGHTRLWEYYQEMAEQIEKMAVGQFEEKYTGGTNQLSGTAPTDLASIDVYGRTGIPIRADASAWLQNIGASNSGVRFGLACSGGGLDIAATGPSAADFAQLALSTSVTSVYATIFITRTFVPITDGIVRVTFQGWLTGAGPQNLNYGRFSVDTRAWAQ